MLKHIIRALPWLSIIGIIWIIISLVRDPFVVVGEIDTSKEVITRNDTIWDHYRDGSAYVFKVKLFVDYYVKSKDTQWTSTRFTDKYENSKNLHLLHIANKEHVEYDAVRLCLLPVLVIYVLITLICYSSYSADETYSPYSIFYGYRDHGVDEPSTIELLDDWFKKFFRVS